MSNWSVDEIGRLLFSNIDVIAVAAGIIALVILTYLAARLHLGARYWGQWFQYREGGTLIIVAIGTFGVRQAMRMVDTFGAAKAGPEVLGVVLADFHQEVFGYAQSMRSVLGRDRVITPLRMPPGVGQGFMHQMEHDPRTKEIWTEEIEAMVEKLRRLDDRHGSTTTTIYYLLPPWSGHYPVAFAAAEALKASFPKPVMHVGYLNLPPSREAELRSNMYRHPEYPGNLALDGTLVSDEQKFMAEQEHPRPGESKKDREVFDKAIASGMAALFAANRLDPGQQHGANPIHSLIEFSKPGRLLAMGIGAHSVAVIPTMLGLRKDIAEQRLSADIARAIAETFTPRAKGWAAPDPPSDVPQFVSAIVPLHPDHPRWNHGRLQRDVLKYLPAGDLPNGCAAIWTAAAIAAERKDTALVLALRLYPVTIPIPIVPVSSNVNGHDGMSGTEDEGTIGQPGRARTGEVPVA